MKVWNILKAIYRRFNEASIIEEIAQAFTLITVVNSIMMVVDLDQPKEGSFAYLHLLTRLAIISLVIFLWEYEDVLSFPRKWIRKEENAKKMVQDLVRKIGQNRFSLLSVLFTFIVAFVSIGSILLQEVLEPAGGRILYQNLLILCATLAVVVLALPRNS